jgi:hypothetical protein
MSGKEEQMSIPEEMMNETLRQLVNLAQKHRDNAVNSQSAEEEASYSAFAEEIETIIRDRWPGYLPSLETPPYDPLLGPKKETCACTPDFDNLQCRVCHPLPTPSVSPGVIEAVGSENAVLADREQHEEYHMHKDITDKEGPYRTFKLVWPVPFGDLRMEWTPGKVLAKRAGVLSMQVDDTPYYLVGWLYAESNVLTCVGPHAWWSNDWAVNISPHESRMLKTPCHAIFATHAVYQKMEF